MKFTGRPTLIVDRTAAVRKECEKAEVQNLSVMDFIHHIYTAWMISDLVLVTDRNAGVFAIAKDACYNKHVTQVKPLTEMASFLSQRDELLYDTGDNS